MSKKYIVYGTGKFSETVVEKMNIFFEDILLFVETKKSKEVHFGKEVISIEELENYLKKLNQKQRYVLLLANTYSNQIKEEIDLTKFEKEFNLELCFPMEWINWIDKADFFGNYHRMLSYIDSIKLELPTINNKKFFVMVCDWHTSSLSLYNIFIGILLRFKGYNTEFIFNDLTYYNSTITPKGTQCYIENFLLNLLNIVKEKYGINYISMSSITYYEENLTEKDFKDLKRAFNFSKVWNCRNLNASNEVKLFEPFFWRNSKIIKHILVKYRPDYVFSFTGMHHDFVSLDILSRNLGISVISSEYIRGGYGFSRYSTAVRQADSIYSLKYLLNNNVDVSPLLSIAEKAIDEVKSHEPINKNGKKIILVPLNIFWDSAAFGESDIFEDFKTWLQFLIEIASELNCIMYIVQHPKELKHGTGNEIKEIFNGVKNENVKFIDITYKPMTYNILNAADLVLPNTSSVGIEAAMLGKKVILKNSAYYAGVGNVLQALDKNEYRKLIMDSINEEIIDNSNDSFEAKLLYSITMENTMSKFLGHGEEDLSNLLNTSIEKILENREFENIINLIENGIPHFISDYLRKIIKVT